MRIYFGATTFDRITKDRAAKFVDMLSAIGGTMGLLTGFSIISAVEILYFAFKFIARALNRQITKRKTMIWNDVTQIKYDKCQLEYSVQNTPTQK